MVFFFWWQPLQSPYLRPAHTHFCHEAMGTAVLGFFDTLGFPYMVTSHWMVIHLCANPNHVL